MEELISDLRETTGNYSGDAASLGIKPRVVGTSLSTDPTTPTIAPEVNSHFFICRIKVAKADPG